MWNRHVTPRCVFINDNTNAVLEINTTACIAYLLYKTTDNVVHIGGVAVERFWNVKKGGCVFHGIADMLPEMRPLQTNQLKSVFIGGSQLNFTLDIDADQSLLEQCSSSCKFTASNDKQSVELAVCRQPVVGKQAVFDMTIPNATVPEYMRWWVTLYHNQLGFDIVMCTLPWNILILPNVNHAVEPHIDDMTPIRGAAGDAVFITGSGFGPHTLVFFDKSAAAVFHTSPNLIKCFVPARSSSSSTQDLDTTVYVCNANIFCTSVKSFRYF